MKPGSFLILFLLVTAFVMPARMLAQTPPPPLEWGEIPKEQLAMTSFSGDSNATAVILCDYGESNLNSDMNLVFTRHRRIKILTNAGFTWGMHSVNIHTADRIESIDKIEGVTYVLKPDGDMEEIEMDDDAIFREDVDGKVTRIRFTLPALAPGCIVEYKYRIKADNLYFIRDWEFQTSEPVLWSEYRVTMPPQIGYAAVTHGYEPYAISENVLTTKTFQGQAAAYLNAEMVRCNLFRWAVANAPALRDEPYITTTDDYINKVTLQFSGYAFAGGGGIKRILKDWETVVNELMDSPSFGKKIKVTGDVQRSTESIVAGAGSQYQKAKAIYDFVRRTIVWSGLHRIFAEKNVDDVLETKSGNSAEVSFLLLSMLESAGIHGSPVLLSTRDNGKVQNLYPIVDQFNYVLCMAMVDGKQVFLDATDPFRPMDLLPRKVLNVDGLVIKEGPVAWTRLASTKQYIHKSVATITLNGDGTTVGTLESADDEYSALDKRRGLKDKKALDIVKDAFAAEETGIVIDSVRVDGRDSVDAQLRLWAHFSSDQYANVAGDVIYINPLVIDRKKNNPFKLRERKFPVDMAYGTKTTTVVNLTLPKGYTVKGQIPDRVVTLKSDAVVYARRCRVENNTVQLVSDLTMKQNYFAPNEYQRLMSFFAEMLNLQNDQIVLQKATGGSSK
jgi:hypothetical protein